MSRSKQQSEIFTSTFKTQLEVKQENRNRKMTQGRVKKGWGWKRKAKNVVEPPVKAKKWLLGKKPGVRKLHFEDTVRFLR